MGCCSRCTTKFNSLNLVISYHQYLQNKSKVRVKRNLSVLMIGRIRWWLFNKNPSFKEDNKTKYMDRYSEGEEVEISNVEVHSSGGFFRIFSFFQEHGERGTIKNGWKTNGIFILTKL